MKKNVYNFLSAHFIAPILSTNLSTTVNNLVDKENVQTKKFFEGTQIYARRNVTLHRRTMAEGT